MKLWASLMLVLVALQGNVVAAECPNCDNIENSVDCDAYITKLAGWPEDEYIASAESDFFGKSIHSYAQKEEVFTAINVCLRQASIYLFNNHHQDKEFVLGEKRLKEVKAAYKVMVEQVEKLEAEKVAALKALDDEMRLNDLKSGKVKISSMADAELMMPDRDALFQLASYPALQATKKIYQGWVRIDLQEGKLLRVKSEIFGMPETYPRYTYLKITKKTVNFSPDSMIIGSTINVIGKYIDNVQYKTVGGEVKTAPVIECYYMGVQ